MAVSELDVTFVDASNISGVYITISLALDPAQAGSNGWWSYLHIWVFVLAGAQILNWTWRYRRNLFSIIQGMPRYMLRLFSREGAHLNDEEAGVTIQHSRLEDNLAPSRTRRHSSTNSRTQHPSINTKTKSCTLHAELQKPRLGAPISAPRHNISIPRHHLPLGPLRNPRRSHTRKYRYKPYPGGDLGDRSVVDDDTMSAVEDAFEDAWRTGFGFGIGG